MSSSLNLFILFSNCKGLNDLSPKFAMCIDLIWIVLVYQDIRGPAGPPPPRHTQFLEFVCQDIRGPAGLNLVGLNLEVSGPNGFDLVGLNLEFSGPEPEKALERKLQQRKMHTLFLTGPLRPRVP